MTAQVVKPKLGPKIFNFLYNYGTLITILLLIVVFAITNDRFLSHDNLIGILRSISIVTIIAIGLTISLSVGGFDLSVGSTASISNAIVVSMFVWYSQPSFIAILAALAVAIVIGFINGFLVTSFKLNDMLMTLATMFIVQGLSSTYTRGATISQNMIMPNGDYSEGTIPVFFSQLGKVPWIIIIMLVIVIIAQIFLSSTKHGRLMYMIGGNPEAAKLSGIPVKRYRYAAYIIGALFAGIGGVILAARVMTAEVNAGGTYLMDAVAAAYIGFAVFGAGKPNAIGTLVGAILLGILSNGLIMLSVPYYAMDIVKGCVLALALALTYYKKQ